MSPCRPIWCGGGAGFSRGGERGRRVAGFPQLLSGNMQQPCGWRTPHGVSRNRHGAQGLDYYSLQKRAKAADTLAEPSGPAFVELGASGPGRQRSVGS